MLQCLPVKPRKIIFDTDPGIDDAMALLFAHRSPALELLGVTTVLGNASIDLTTRNALYLVERFNINAPVHRGAAKALQVPEDEVPTFVHGDDGLGNIQITPPAKTAGGNAARFIVDTIMAAPGEVTLVAIGRLTNLALALQLQPRIADLVAEVIVMGGALGSNEFTGNVSPVAEANIYGDPHAADIVFTAAWPVVLVGLDVTMQCVRRPQQTQRLRDAGGEAGRFIWDITRHYEDFYRRRRSIDGFPIHDSAAIAYAIAPELFGGISGAVRVPTEGISRGQTILVPADRQFPPSAWDDIPHCMGCTHVDVSGVLNLYEQTLLDNQ